jgi:hypothetical protein
MDAKEIKQYLKNAREAIKNKDFKTALQLCKVSSFVYSEIYVIFLSSEQKWKNRQQKCSINFLQINAFKICLTTCMAN